MSVTAKVLINAQFATNAVATYYTVPTGVRTIIDKFTATNTDGSAHTLTVFIVPVGQGAGPSNTIISALTFGAGVTSDASSIQNQILAAGDIVAVQCDASSKVVIRMSGREVT